MKKLSFIKKQGLIIVSLIAIVFLSGCGISSGLMNQLSVNSTNTSVVLQKNNFKVIGNVNGDATDSYVFGIGLNKRYLVAKAKQNMIDNAKLEGSSKAIINITIEEHVTLMFVYVKRTIIMHGTVIEFTE
jgi:hypothetical protein